MYVILILLCFHLPDLIYILLPGFILRFFDYCYCIYQLFWKADVLDVQVLDFPPSYIKYFLEHLI